MIPPYIGSTFKLYHRLYLFTIKEDDKLELNHKASFYSRVVNLNSPRSYSKNTRCDCNGYFDVLNYKYLLLKTAGDNFARIGVDLQLRAAASEDYIFAHLSFSAPVNGPDAVFKLCANCIS